ncbi:MAG TPA: hypothetical protein VF278_05030, partial [Pirellulales bacterium]
RIILLMQTKMVRRGMVSQAHVKRPRKTTGPSFFLPACGITVYARMCGRSNGLPCQMPLDTLKKDGKVLLWVKRRIIG